MRKLKDSTISTCRLMDRVKNSDMVAFEILFDRLWENLFLRAVSIIKDRDLAKDIVQEVFIDFWNRRLSIQNDNIEGYLMQAVRFKVYKELRDNKLTRYHKDFLQSFSIATTDSIEEELNLADTKNLVNIAVEHLPKKCHQVFMLSRHEGLDNQTISEKLGISQRTVETHISNAIRSIKKEVIF